MVALRSGQFYHFVGYGFCVRYGRAALEAHLCVSFDIADFSHARPFVYHNVTYFQRCFRTKLMARRTKLNVL